MTENLSTNADEMLVTPQEQEALDFLFDVALSAHYGTARKIADFLLWWWNDREFLTFPTSLLWQDEKHTGAVLLAITAIARNAGKYPQSRQADIETIIEKCRPSMVVSPQR
ncbi:MAG: hypothetical protein LBQ75_08705 [Zoogloeaceae bacterium]|nr:hypothetical protein [Zoogloeaceae bacterium]